MMSSLFSYFGGGGAKKNNSKEAIVKLRQQLEMLRKREIHTEKQMLEQDAIARKNITTNKTGMFHVPLAIG
jgi:charged multivesicular body protein 4